MSLLNFIVRHTVGIVCELLTMPDPYDRPVTPHITGLGEDECRRPVIEVVANSYRDVERFTEGLNYPGAMQVHTHVGPNLWVITFEGYISPSNLTMKDYQEFLDRERGT